MKMEKKERLSKEMMEKETSSVYLQTELWFKTNNIEYKHAENESQN